MSDRDDKSAAYSSPPCFMHELENAVPSIAGDAVAWADVRRWRKAERARLIEARLAVPAATRALWSTGIAAGLDEIIGDAGGRTLSLYWPFRGEPDLRPWLNDLNRRGWRTALPIVEEAGRPLIFRAYRSGDRLEKGVWNIPVPVDGEIVLPEVVVAPLVGVDPANFRLGYGGGFFDRTLAALPRKPLTVGIGYQLQRIASIYPQPHDIPMDRIVTENGPQI